MEVYNKIKQKIRKHVSSAKGRRQVIFYTGVVVLAFLFFAVVWLIQFGPIGNTLSQEIQKTERDSLTGVLIEQRTELKQVYGVMIDEHTDARSQSGIDQAFLVIEAPVEAGIPRLLSFFSEAQDVKKIGPVRSARPYFLDWAKEFGALYAHVGGSDEALEKIKIEKMFDLNEFWNGNYFWRSEDRFAPHNTYISSELLGRYVAKKIENGRYQKPTYGIWQFQDGIATKGLVQSFQISYLNPGYVFEWKYDEAKNVYVRWNESQIAKTQDGNDLVANNVAIVVTDVKVIDSVGRRRIRTTGEGEAVLFQNGNRIKAIWKKYSVNDRLRFYGSDGVEQKMNTGTTWIEVISNSSQLIEK